VSCGEPPEPGALLDHERRQGVSRLALGAGVTVKLRRDVRNDHAGYRLARIYEHGTQNRVPVGTGMNGCMLLPDLFAPFQVGSADIHERGIFVEEGRKRIHIMPIPGVGEACYEFTRITWRTHS